MNYSVNFKITDEQDQKPIPSNNNLSGGNNAKQFFIENPWIHLRAKLTRNKNLIFGTDLQKQITISDEKLVNQKLPFFREIEVLRENAIKSYIIDKDLIVKRTTFDAKKLSKNIFPKNDIIELNENITKINLDKHNHGKIIFKLGNLNTEFNLSIIEELTNIYEETYIVDSYFDFHWTFPVYIICFNKISDKNNLSGKSIVNKINLSLINSFLRVYAYWLIYISKYISSDENNSFAKNSRKEFINVYRKLLGEN